MDINKIEKEIIQLNRQGKQDFSQKRILAELESDNLSKENTIKLYLLLSSTFRSVNDYLSSIYYLKIAKNLSRSVNNADSLRTSISVEEAFTYFDNREYASSGKIIQEIEAKKFRFVDPEDRAYLIMQDGYICFLRKDYEVAGKKLDESLQLIKKINPCNQPFVMVKQMQLTAAKGNINQAESIYNKIISIADSCKMMKSKVYATEELFKIFKNSNNKEKVLFYSKILDSVRDLSKIDERLSRMYVANEKHILKKSNQDKEKNIILYSSLFIILLIVLGCKFQ